MVVVMETRILVDAYVSYNDLDAEVIGHPQKPKFG